IESMGRRTLPLQMDVMRIAEIFGALQQAEAFFGKIDILVNNAGGGFTNLAADVSESEFDATLTLNLKSTFFASQAAAKIMARHGGGKIINMSSQAAFAALPTESVYCASKAAISQLTKCLAVEWGPQNITVNAVAPTFIATPGTEEQLSDPAFRADVIERIAGLHRLGEPMAGAGAVVFLASPAAALITGHTMLIDGGWTARGLQRFEVAIDEGNRQSHHVEILTLDAVDELVRPSLNRITPGLVHGLAAVHIVV